MDLFVQKQKETLIYLWLLFSFVNWVSMKTIVGYKNHHKTLKNLLTAIGFLISQILEDIRTFCQSILDSPILEVKLTSKKL